MSDVEACKAYIESFRNGVGKSCKVVAPEELGQEWLYHISMNPGIKKFVPQLTQRTATNEDRSVPRISVAPTIFGCILGYVNDGGDWRWGRSEKAWKDGWYIYGFRNQVSVKPAVKVLFDADWTDERWLVPYKPEKWVYVPELIGKYFYRTVSETQANDRINRTIEAYFEVVKGAVVNFSPEAILTEGHWSLRFERSGKTWDKSEVSHLTKLTPAEWSKVKGQTADLLSHQEPPSARW